MKAYERIIRSRGDVPVQDRQEPPSGEFEEYAAYRSTEGFPQMGFSVFGKYSGDYRERHVFLYHNLDNLNLIEKGEHELVRFTHRGVAVSMRGRDLHGLVEAIIAHTLQAIYEYDDALYLPIQPGGRIIDRMEVTSLPGTGAAAS